MNANSLNKFSWIEIFHNGANAENFLPTISNLSQIVVSVIALYEVWRYTIQHADRARALAITDSMQQGDVVSIDPEIAIEAAHLSVQRRIPNDRLPDLHHCPKEFRHPLDSRRGFRGPSERPLLPKNQSLNLICTEDR